MIRLEKKNNITCDDLWNLKKIDQGEYDFACELSVKNLWYEVYELYEDHLIIGLFTIFLDATKLRIQISNNIPLDHIVLTQVKQLIDRITCEHHVLNIDVWLSHFSDETKCFFTQVYSKNTVVSSHEFKRKTQKELVDSSFHLRKYNSQDLNQVIDLLEDSFKKLCKDGYFEHQKTHLSSFFLDQHTMSMCLYDQEKCIGFFAVSKNLVEYVAISTQVRRKGLGRLLMSHISNVLYENGFSFVYLYCLDENIDAIAFYQSIGYELTARSCHIEIIL